MGSRSKWLATLALSAGLGLGALGWAGPALAAAKPDQTKLLEQKIQMLEQSLMELKGQLQQVQSNQQMQAEKAVVQERKVQAMAAAPAPKETKLPPWLERISLFGDFRLRYENLNTDDFKGKSTDSRERWRYRLRVGVRSIVNDDLMVAMRMASGADSDPTSTNETMTNWFSEKSWGIDQAYAKYAPTALGRALTLWGGKHPNPFVTSNIMWDGDIVPECFTANYVFNKKGAFQPFVTMAAMFVKESASDNPGDANLFVPQAGFKFKTGPWGLTAATSYYNWDNFSKNGNYPTDLRGNVAKSNKDLADFGVWDVYAKVEYKLPSKVVLSGRGHYMVNTKEDLTGAAAGKDKGYDVGVGLKYDRFGFSADYKVIEANATPGYFSDSDFGHNNRKGFVLSGKYKIFDYTTAQLTYYNSKAEDDKLIGAKADYQMIHADLIFEF